MYKLISIGSRSH